MAKKPEPVHKYKLKIEHLLDRSNIHKLTKDGFSRAEIHKVLHREAEGATRQQKNDIISSLYDRKE